MYASSSSVGARRRGRHLRWVAAILVLVAIGRWTACRRRAPAPLLVDDAYLSALCTGIVDWAVQNGARESSAVVLMPQRNGPAAARDRQLVDALRRIGTRAGMRSWETVWVPVPSGGPSPGVPIEQWVELLRQHGNSGLWISFIGGPVGDVARLRPQRGSAKIAVVEEEVYPWADRSGAWLASGAVDAVIRPRGTIGAESARGSGDPRQAFAALFEIRQRGP